MRSFFYRPFIFFLFWILYFNLSAFSLVQEDTVRYEETSGVSENISLNKKEHSGEGMSNPFLSDLTRVQEALTLSNLNKSLSLLQALLLKVRQVHAANIDGFFPSDTENFFVVQQKQVDQGVMYSDGYGIIFSKQYQTQDGRFLDVNVVFNDPSIQEYISIIQEKSAVADIEGVRVIKIQDRYMCLESVSDEHQFIERNIVLNPDVLVNVVYDWRDDDFLLNEFVSQFQLVALEQYLLN
ncbi:MAG: hypothetical protein VW378_03870 [bacterium]